VDANRLKDVRGQTLLEIRGENLDGGAVKPLMTTPPVGELGGAIAPLRKRFKPFKRSQPSISTSTNACTRELDESA
jgi:hypothetical protein